jgi:hypothetical protein
MWTSSFSEFAKKAQEAAEMAAKTAEVSLEAVVFFRTKKYIYIRPLTNIP